MTNDVLGLIARLLGNTVFIAVLAGISGAIGASLTNYVFPSWLQRQRFKHERGLTSLQHDLKWKEILFSRRIAAVDALLSMDRQLSPRYSHPDMDWHDACVSFASELGPAEKVLETFLEKHSVGLSPEVLALLQELPGWAADNSFFELETPDQEPPRTAIDTASKILQALSGAKELVLKEVNS